MRYSLATVMSRMDVTSHVLMGHVTLPHDTDWSVSKSSPEDRPVTHVWMIMHICMSRATCIHDTGRSVSESHDSHLRYEWVVSHVWTTQVAVRVNPPQPPKPRSLDMAGIHKHTHTHARTHTHTHTHKYTHTKTHTHIHTYIDCETGYVGRRVVRTRCTYLL